MKKIGVVGTETMLALLIRALEYFESGYKIEQSILVDGACKDSGRMQELVMTPDMEFVVIASDKEDYFFYEGLVKKAADARKREVKIRFLHPYLKYIHHFHLFHYEKLFLDREEYANSIDYLEFHVTDNCNLNCKGCAHFSNIVSGKKNTDFLSWEKDMSRLKELVEKIYTIRIMGGEPFLNLELGKFVAKTRELFPQSLIHVVSNGMLLHKVDQDVFRLIRENDVTIDISYYPEVDRDKAAEILEAENLRYRISTVPTDEFLKYMNLKGDSDIGMAYAGCGFKECHFLYEGKVSVCAFPLLVKYFNEYFHENVDAGCGIDLYSPRLKKGMLRGLLNRPVDACRYCAVDKEPIPWKGHWLNADKSDWCVKGKKKWNG